MPEASYEFTSSEQLGSTGTAAGDLAREARSNEQARSGDRGPSGVKPRAESRVWMSQSYEGVVEDVDGDAVVVVYDVDGKIVEQTYEKSQFTDGRLPEVGSRLAVYVTVAEVQSDPIDVGVEESNDRDESKPSRRRLLSGPTEF